MRLLRRLFDFTAPEDPARALRCALCERRVGEVEHMIKSSSGAVCNSCIVASMVALTPVESLGRAVLDMLAALDPMIAFGDSAPIIEAARVLLEGRKRGLWNVASQAMRVWRFDLAVAMLQRVAAPASRPSLAFAHYRLGEYTRARQVLADVDPAALNEEARLYYLLNLAVGLTLGEHADSRTVLPLLDDAHRLASDLDQRVLSHDEYRKARGAIEVGRGVVALHAGDCKAAELSLRRAVDEFELRETRTLLFLGDALRGQQRVDEARDEWKRALDITHPESFEAGLLRGQLNGVYR